jgi:hypothetical protein
MTIPFHGYISLPVGTSPFSPSEGGLKDFGTKLENDLSMKIYITMALILITPLTMGQSQNAYDPSRYIAWNPYYDLDWDDFKATKDISRFGDAGTAVKIIAKPYLVKNDVNYQVFALFDKSASWASEESKELLAHEQLHFDIAEVYARRVRKKVKELQLRGETRIAAYNKEIEVLLQESNVTDAQYDNETLHGAIQERQKEWQENIDSALESLEEFRYQPTIISK